jgi:hypothetical protein
VVNNEPYLPQQLQENWSLTMQRLLTPEMTSAEIEANLEKASEADLRAELALIELSIADKVQQKERLTELQHRVKAAEEKNSKALKVCSAKLNKNPSDPKLLAQLDACVETKTKQHSVLRMNNAKREQVQQAFLDQSILKQMINKRLANVVAVAPVQAPALDDIEQAFANNEAQPLLDQPIHQNKTDAYADFLAALNKHEKDYPRQMINAAGRVGLQFVNDKSDLARDILVSAKNILEDNSPANHAHYENLVNTPAVRRKKTAKVVSILCGFLGAAMLAAGIALGITLIGLPAAAPLIAVGASLIVASAIIATRGIYTENEAALVNLGKKAKPGFFNRSQTKTGAGWVKLENTTVYTKFSV